MNNLSPRDIVRRAFDRIYDRHPFLASIVASWKVVETRKIPTAATNGPELWYNPEFVGSLKIAEAVDLMLHEAGHIFLGHHMRFADKKPKDWNVAADLALNWHIMKYLDETGKIRQLGVFPGERQFAKLPVGKDAEFYYRNLPKEPEGEGEGEEGQEGDEGEQGQGKGKGKGQQPQNGSQRSQGGAGKGEQDGEEGAGGDGQGAQREPMSLGEIMPHPDSADEEAMEEAERQWEQQVARAINDAKAQGNLPGWIETLAGEMYAKKSEVNWKAVLRRFLSKYAPVKFSYSRPNRRSSYRKDIILPARHSLEAAPGCILVDTSGSMSDAECNLALSEIEGILSAYNRCEVTMRQADTRLLDVERKFTRWDFPLRKPDNWKGRGGTDLAPAIMEIGKNRNFKWLVVVTDTGWDMHSCPNPGIPTMWVVTQEYMYGKPPTFGTVIGPLKVA